MSTMVNIGDRSPERARQDYVKVIFLLGQDGPVHAADVARTLGVTRASVSKFKRLLEREGLLAPSRRTTDALQLTRRGQTLALRMVRRHRLVETFLHKTLRVPLERVHSEAERIEHAISDDISARLAGFLDHPRTDPHGHRIPRGGVRAIATTGRPLRSVTAGHTVVITRIDDRSAALVRTLARHGVLPGARARVTAISGAGMRIVIKRRAHVIPWRTAGAVHCIVTTGRQEVA